MDIFKHKYKKYKLKYLQEKAMTGGAITNVMINKPELEKKTLEFIGLSEVFYVVGQMLNIDISEFMELLRFDIDVKIYEETNAQGQKKYFYVCKSPVFKLYETNSIEKKYPKIIDMIYNKVVGSIDNDNTSFYQKLKSFGKEKDPIHTMKDLVEKIAMLNPYLYDQKVSEILMDLKLNKKSYGIEKVIDIYGSDIDNMIDKNMLKIACVKFLFAVIQLIDNIQNSSIFNRREEIVWNKENHNVLNTDSLKDQMILKIQQEILFLTQKYKANIKIILDELKNNVIKDNIVQSTIILSQNLFDKINYIEESCKSNADKSWLINNILIPTDGIVSTFKTPKFNINFLQDRISSFRSQIGSGHTTIGREYIGSTPVYAIRRKSDFILCVECLFCLCICVAECLK